MLAVLVLLFFTKVVAVITERPGTLEIISVVGIFCLIYTLFVLEGLHHVASNLHTADPEGVSAYISSEYKGSQLNSIRRNVDLLQKNFRQFLAGRQICILAIVVLVARAIEQMSVGDNSVIVSFLPSSTNGFNIHAYMMAALNSVVVTFALATLLPCWVAQILPEMLAHQKSIGFIARWPCHYIARLAIAAGALGAAWPGERLFLFIRGGDSGEDRNEVFEIGKVSLYRRVSSHVGRRVVERRISISVQSDQLKINDFTSVEYTGIPRNDISHVIRVFMQHTSKIELVGVGANAPEGQKEELRYGNLEVVTTDKVTKKVESRETIFALEKKLGYDIPRSPGHPDRVDYNVEYTADPLSLEPQLYSDFHFDVMRPTKLVLVEIDCEDGLFVVMPKLYAQPVDELLVLAEQRFEQLRAGTDFTIEASGAKTVVRMDYPNIAMRYAVMLDARRAEKSATAIAAGPAVGNAHGQ